MAHLFRIVGRLAGKAARSHAFDRALSVATSYIISEMRLTDLHAKLALLRKKRANHIHLLGKTVWRQMRNDIDPHGTEHFTRIVNVLTEIDGEIELVSNELERRRNFERARRRSPSTDGHTGGTQG